MGFFNKPGKATRGAINKVVREIDRVCMTGNQFQREYGTPQPQPQPQPQPHPSIPDIESSEVDHEFPQYFKRNKCGLMIPLPEYYPEYIIQFAVTVSHCNMHNINVHKHQFNTKWFIALCPTLPGTFTRCDGEYLPWEEYIERTMQFVKFGHPSTEFNFIIQSHP
jgi:hypothetical protein